MFFIFTMMGITFKAVFLKFFIFIVSNFFLVFLKVYLIEITDFGFFYFVFLFCFSLHLLQLR